MPRDHRNIKQWLAQLWQSTEPIADSPPSITIAHAHIDQVIISTHTHITTCDTAGEEATFPGSDTER